MTALLWFVILVHLLAAGFFFARWRVKRVRREPGYQITGLMAYLALAPAFGAARELRFFRVEVAGALAVVSALLGVLLLWAIWKNHFTGQGGVRSRPAAPGSAEARSS